VFAQNPPVRDLLELDPKPEEIWVVRLNPRRVAQPPRTGAEIADRRNELVGNLALDHELWAIGRFNRLRLEFPALQARYDAVTVREVELPIALDHASKLDRAPSHLRALRESGAGLAPLFFTEASVVVPPDGGTPPVREPPPPAVR
jgi:NTE family protein